MASAVQRPLKAPAAAVQQPVTWTQIVREYESNGLEVDVDGPPFQSIEVFDVGPTEKNHSKGPFILTQILF